MKTLLILALTAVITAFGLTACTPDPVDAIPPVSAAGITVKKTMKAFKSDVELARYFRELAEKQRQRSRRGAIATPVAGLPNSDATMDAAEPQSLSAAKSVDPAESVTNVQHAGVDEGGIVKTHGNHLVILRRGRLFTVAVGDGALKPVSAVNAFGPDIDPTDTWYDEMLIADNTVVVIGYSYESGGTEVGLFDIHARLINALSS